MTTPTTLEQAALHGIRRVINDQPSDEELAESTTSAILDALPIKGWWVETDGVGEPTVWMPDSDRPGVGVPVARIGSTHPDVWDLLTTLVAEKPDASGLTDDFECLWCAGGYAADEDGVDDTFCSEECRAAEQAEAERRADASPVQIGVEL